MVRKRNVIRQISSCFFILLFKEFLIIHAVRLEICEGGGYTLGAQRIIIIDANCYNFHIVETSELPWGSNRACLGSAGSLKRSPDPPFHFCAYPQTDSRLRTYHDNDMYSGDMS